MDGLASAVSHESVVPGYSLMWVRAGVGEVNRAEAQGCSRASPPAGLPSGIHLPTQGLGMFQLAP